MISKLKLGWFSTSKGKTSIKIFKNIYTAIKNKELNIELKFVFINRALGESDNSDKFIRYVLNKKISLVTFSSKRYLPKLRQENINTWRKKYYEEVYKLIKDFDVDIILLAGYMLILSEDMCKKMKFINLHPALPWGPKGKWDEVIKEIIFKKYSEHGVMIHLVTKEIDRGPVLCYTKFNIKKFDFNKIREKGLKYEIPLIKKTLELLETKKLFIKGQKIFFKSKLLNNGYEINPKILEKKV